MHSDDSFEEMLRDIAREFSESIQRTVSDVDVDGIAETIGVDPDRAREWLDTAVGMLRAQAGQMAFRRSSPTEDPLRNAQPHALDLPTDEQGLALAALDSGRWTVEPGSRTLTGRGDGPAPNDALGLVRELHARDWITIDGEVTLVGRHALSRWLDRQA
jgi:hypothetical protein